jgi:hypothetical protein
MLRSAKRMKAAHRKELQTNALADRMGRLVETVKAGPKSTSAVIWIFVLVALGTFAVWRYYRSSNPDDESARWVSLRTATHDPGEMPRDLQRIIDQNKGTMQARVARFQLARFFVREGQEMLASDMPLTDEDLKTLKQIYGPDALSYSNLHTRRDQAIEMLRRARDSYEQMRREVKSFPLLYQEALMGSAKTEEALAGVTDESGTPQGSLDRAVELYREMVQFNLKQLGKSVAPDQAVPTLENLVCGQLKELGQECEPASALQTYQRLLEVSPEKFKGQPGAWRDLSSPGRNAAQRVQELQQQRDQVQNFYAGLNKFATPRKLEEPKVSDELKKPEAPKPPEEPKKPEVKKEEPKPTAAPTPSDTKKDPEPKKSDAPSK